MKSLVRLGALLTIAGLALSACGGGGGGGSTPPTPIPTATPPPSVVQELCPTTGVLPQAVAAQPNRSTLAVARRRPARVSKAGVVPDLLAVTYDVKNAARTAQSLRPDTLSDAEKTAGALELARSLSFDRLGEQTHVVRVAPEQLQQTMAKLRTQSGVKSVAVVHYRRALSASSISVDDPYYAGFGAPGPYFETNQLPGQWNMHIVDVGQAWGYSQPNSTGQVFPAAIDGAPIAILDTGFDLTHPELSNMKVARAHCYVTFGGYSSDGPYVTDYDGHGTNVSGYASGDTNNAVGFASVGFNTPLLLYRVFPTPPKNPPCDDASQQTNPECSVSAVDEASAISDAIAHQARVINLSIGAEGPNCTDQTELTAIENAISQGVVVVAAAGNGNSSSGLANPQLACPAAYPGVIAVGASALDDSGSTIKEKVASYSDYDAAHPTTWGLVAPGGDPDATQQNCSTASCIDYLQWIYGIYSSTAYSPGNCAPDFQSPTGTADCRILIAGTSMSTPHVAGAAALILGAKPALTPSQVLGILCSTTDPISGTNSSHQGCGRLNVYHALAKAIGDPSP
ncbi:MAG: S8 family peptidase [Vulcanimicrobiaceae bacterium]